MRGQICLPCCLPLARTFKSDLSLVGFVRFVEEVARAQLFD